MLIRGPHLSSTMSDYLVQRIHASKSITLHTCSEVVSLEGANHLSHVTWQSVVTGEKTRFEAEHLFVMIGADPCTTWLRDCVDLDAHGFVRTSFGSEVRGLFETSVPGIFAVGDVRSGSVKRVACAVGEVSVVSRLFIAIWVLLGRSVKGVFRFPGANTVPSVACGVLQQNRYGKI